MKIGVFGSAGKVNSGLRKKARKVGRALGKHNVIVITGACSGLPYAAASEASKTGVKVWGFSPVLNMSQQRKFTPRDDLSIYGELNFIPPDFEHANNLLICKKYRNVLSTAACDAAIIIHGEWGTLNEFTNLVDMGKVVGVLTGGGGIADELEQLVKKVEKRKRTRVVFSNSPEELVERVLKRLTRDR